MLKSDKPSISEDAVQRSSLTLYRQQEAEIQELERAAAEQERARLRQEAIDRGEDPDLLDFGSSDKLDEEAQGEGDHMDHGGGMGGGDDYYNQDDYYDEDGRLIQRYGSSCFVKSDIRASLYQLSERVKLNCQLGRVNALLHVHHFPMSVGLYSYLRQKQFHNPYHLL